MSNLCDVVFCFDCDRNVAAHRSAAGGESGGALNEPPRRMAVKKDANGDQLCVSCLDLRRASRNAEFLLRAGRVPISDADSQTIQATGTQRGEPAARPQMLRIASLVRIPRPARAEQAAPRASRASIEQARTRAPSKTELARSKPAGTKVKDVAVRVATARTIGPNRKNTTARILTAPSYVEVMRSGTPAGRAATASIAKHAAAGMVARKREAKAKSRDLERTFLQLTVEIGVLRARALLDELRKKLRGLGN